jgi:hypothetical protein
MKITQLVSVIALGVIACVLDFAVLSNAWAGLGWRAPIAELIRDSGFPGTAGIFGLIWIRIPTFFVAGVLGFSVARLVPGRWMTAAVLGGVAFVGTSLILTVSIVRQIGWPLLLRVEGWSPLSIALCFLAAWFSARKFNEVRTT